MTISTEAEVIVVGGGPAGTATALYLAQSGRRVLLLEGRDFSKTRAADMRSGEVLSPGSQQELLRLGLPLNAGNWRLLPFDKLQHTWPNGRTTLDNLPNQLEFWQIDRGCFDRAMSKFTRDYGVTVLEGCRVSNLLQNSAGAAYGVVTKAGDEPGQVLHAPIIVDASGRRSALLARLKLKEPEPEFQRIALVTFYETMPNCTPGVWEQHFLAAHNTVLKGSMMRENLYRFSFETDLAFRDEFAAQYGKQTPHAMVLAILQKYNPELYARFSVARPLAYSTAYAPIGYRVRQIIQDGLVMVGDAAGYLDPSTGQGIEFALRTARLASASIEQALAHHDYSQAQFGPYMEARRHEIQKSMNSLRFFLRVSRQKNLLSLASYFPPARAAVMRSMVRPRPVIPTLS